MSAFTSDQPTLAFIGAGNMAAAIIGGLASKGFPADRIWAADPLQANLLGLRENHAINTSDDNAEAIKHADVVILAVKPQIMQKVIDQTRAALVKKQPLIISIAAGVTAGSIQKWLGQTSSIVRCMPNTPALVQTGATALYANAQVSELQRGWADQLLSAIGIACWVDEESQLDAVTALSGSGPAYFFLVMEAMQKAGNAMGLAPDLVQKLTLQTALGAAKMALDSDVDAAELRQRVSSPGGTTVAALDVFEEGQFIELFAKALSAAQQRSQELAEELDG